jgi:hypothetical protein
MRFVACATVAVALLAAAPAFADPTPQDIQQARELSGQANAAFEAGNYGEAEKLFAAASNLYPAAPTLTLGLARSQAKSGKYVLAKENYNKIIREQSNNSNASQAFKDALASAQAEIDGVSAKIGHVTITIDGLPPNAQVTVDGEEVKSAGLGVPRPIDPGQHKVVAAADGYATAEASFNVTEAGSAAAKLTMVKNAAPVTGPTGPTSPTEAPKTSFETKRDHTLAAIALGVGGAGLVFGGITGAIALGKHSTLAKDCTGGKCPETDSKKVDSYHTMAMLSTVGFIVGGVGVAAGAVLWFAGPTKQVQIQGNAVSVQPYFAGNGGGFAGRF